MAEKEKEPKAKVFQDITPVKKSPKLEQIEKLVTKDSKRVADMLKNWINEEA